MMNITRLFNIKNGDAEGWTNSDRTTFILNVDCDMLTMNVTDGRNPFVNEVKAAMLLFIAEYLNEFGSLDRYERKNRYRFASRQGMSGCVDMFLEEDRGDGFPRRHFLYHVSCFDKVGGMKLFVYDLLDLMAAEGFLTVNDGRYGVPAVLPDQIAGIGDIKFVKPRFTELEEGWTAPDDVPESVVPLKTCRVKPEPETED